MDQREARLLAAIDQGDERVQMLELSLHSISKFIKALIVSNNVANHVAPRITFAPTISNK